MTMPKDWCNEEKCEELATLRAEVERLKKQLLVYQMRDEGKVRCENCSEWTDFQEAVRTADDCDICQKCAKVLAEEPERQTRRGEG
jgi:hypothetical protein